LFKVGSAFVLIMHLSFRGAGEEIVDETDVPERTKDAAEDREEAFRWARLRMLDSKIVDQNLSYDEARAVTAHLWLNYPQAVSLLTEHQLHRLIAETPVVILPTAAHDIGQSLPTDLLYERGVVADFATLMLTGKVTVVAGADNFRSDVSNWSLLGRNALLDANYQPDFSAYVSSGPCRCIFIKRAKFVAAVDASVLERRSVNNGAPKPPPMQSSSQLAKQQNQDLGKQQKLLTALQFVGQSGRTDSLPDNSPRPSGTSADMIRRPSLINMTTVPRAEKTPQIGKRGRR
jgi:hypothetical protein